MLKTGLLILSSSALKPYVVLSRCCEFVQNSLYVHLINVTNFDTHPHGNPLPRTKSTLNFINKFYSHSAKDFRHLNIVFITSNIPNYFANLQIQHRLSQDYDVILTDIDQEYENHIQKYALTYFPNQSAKNVKIQRLQNLETSLKEREDGEVAVYQHTCVGGTFDRLHAGHKILLNHTLLATQSKLTIGVTDGEMNRKKVLTELMEPTSKRIDILRQFIRDSDPTKEASIVPITDMYGPTVTDASIDCLIVSEETHKGGNAVNQERAKRGLSELSVEVLGLVNDGEEEEDDEIKVSSSKARKKLLGTLLKPLQLKDHLPPKPYIIGLTGGIASGKSSISKGLEDLGTGVINCDALGHESYLPGTQAYQQIIDHFGSQIVTEESGIIDRAQLGAIVFQDKSKLSLLNSIVWPSIQKLTLKYIQQLVGEGKEVVVLDAAVLLEAGWQAGVHEVWVAVIDPLEAERRIVERNGIPAEKARERIQSQMTNNQRVDKANVVLCTLWEYAYTQKQVERSWDLLNKRRNTATKTTVIKSTI